MVASDSFAEFLRQQFAPLGRVTVRRMFGETGVFSNGLMRGMVTDDTLYVRVDDYNRTVFNEAEAEAPINYEKQGRTIDLAFGRVPEHCSTNPISSSPGHARRGGGRRVAAKRERPAPRRNQPLRPHGGWPEPAQRPGCQPARAAKRAKKSGS